MQRTRIGALVSALVVASCGGGSLTLAPRYVAVHNTMAAMGLALASGVPADIAIRGIESVTAPPGRFEHIDAGQPFDVIVDYAHTPDALEQLLLNARGLARGRMIAEMRGGIPTGPLKGKDFEGGNSMGPWIVTADEIPDPASLRMEVRVNGETKGVGSTADMHHPIASMIAVASEGERLCEGEFFGTGAVGDGTGIERWEFLSPGDIVELEIEHIGVLRNRVGSRSEKGAALG